MALGQLILFLAIKNTQAALLPTNFSLNNAGVISGTVHKMLDAIGAMYSNELKNLIG